MTELVGILYKDEEKAFGKKLDELVDFRKFGKTGWLKWVMKLVEAKDNDFFTAGIMYIDNRFGKLIPSMYKTAARNVALAVINDDYEKFKTFAPILINQMVDIPRMEEETEGIIIAALIVGIVNAFETQFITK